jgi:hypothetical protein
MREVGVIYLYRFAEGERPARRFLKTYSEHSAGVDHDLHVVFKGFPDQATLARGHALFAETDFNSVELDDSGYDIGSYFKAAKIVSNPKLIFLNSFSEILCDDWLKHFDRALSLRNVGLAGASGSWQANTSSYEAALATLLRGTSRWENVGTWPIKFLELLPFVHSDNTNFSIQERKRSIKRYLFGPFDYVVRFCQYGRYPNPHIRTNAFMIERDCFLSLTHPVFSSKSAVYRFESGRKSLTNQILAKGLTAVVLGRNGDVYDIPEWKSSSTFWINDQVNLIVADNRTTDYAQGNQVLRRRLENSAWIHPWLWSDEVQT